MKKILLFITVSLSMSVYSKDLMYPVSTISPLLLENAHTVYRTYNQELEIKSEKMAILTITEVRTILNKNGEENGLFIGHYDPMNKITSLKGKVYNAVGKQIKSLGGDDVLDYSAISGFSMYEDNRVKYIDPKNQTYPYTVEYTYETQLKHTLFLPSWTHNEANTSFEHSNFTIKAPSTFVLRYKEFNLQNPVKKTTSEGQDIYSWSLSNLPVSKDEPLQVINSYSSPTVLLAPNKFEFGDSKGSSATWKDLGIWVSTLNQNKDNLPEATKLKMKEITANCKDDFEKVKVIYEYMQKKTRYVSIQVGIGGFQPFDAETVDRTSYGDCKALSNYTKALLSSVGVKSFYALVNAGGSTQNIDTSFSSSQFNHAFVCVPMKNDTIWLECTSQRLPCGFNSDFTDDRDVLIIDGENSKIVHTRVYSSAENCISRNYNVSLTDEIDGIASCNTKFTGLCYDDIYPIYYSDNADKQKIITQSVHLPTFSLTNFNLKEHRSNTPSIDQTINLTFSNYIRKVGNVALLPLNFMNKFNRIPEKIRNRKFDMTIRRSYMENDTISYQVPKNFEISALPEKVEIRTKFGSYTALSSKIGNNIIYNRHFELRKGTFAAKDYIEYREFLENVSAADEAVASLKKL